MKKLLMSQHESKKNMQQLSAASYLSAGNAPYLESLYEDFLADPESVAPALRAYFEQLAPPSAATRETSHAAFREIFRAPLGKTICRDRGGISSHDMALLDKQVRVAKLINAYRFNGHLLATINPLQSEAQAMPPELTLAYHGLGEEDLDQPFDTVGLARVELAPLREILALLAQIYTQAIGAEFMHLTDMTEKRWLLSYFEGERGQPQYPIETKRRLLELLTAAEGLERFLHSKYVGQKRFSLEGADSLVPMMDCLIQRAGEKGVKELAIGMAHRGRLNMLVNILGKLPEDLFREFEGKVAYDEFSTGDVKYHMGFSSNVNTPGGLVHLALAFNPSHLEIVGPVVEGSVRARQDRRNDHEGDTVVPVIIHGDAAFAGQGVVMETFNMSQSRGYSTKGTVHIVINNQIGFTTSNQRDMRSTLYCTDVAKMVNTPIFHVNGDDPEAVLFVTRLALDYRMKFHKDVVIDLVCYRRHGHSEADEPMATQPAMYNLIRAKKTPREIYAHRLIEQGAIDEPTPLEMMKNYRQAIEGGQCVAKDIGQEKRPPFTDWEQYTQQACTVYLDTGVPKKLIQELNDRLSQHPKHFTLHASVAKVYANRAEMAAGKLPLDWGFAETMAYATLLKDGYHVRLSGQDCGRGTFFHRHAVIHNQADEEAYVPLRNLFDNQPRFLVINSLLSEEAVLAFEYGYSTTDPKTLTIWEAQFGDFANNAQVVIDQFISAGEQKWKRLSGLTLFLPHGFEGQGPEHSSARLERYLQLCAQHNMQVAVPTTPAQIFHLLRRQMLLSCRKPLIVMTPKSLLRHKDATSTLEELTRGAFQPVIPEIDALDDDAVTRVVMCSGKIYYELLDKRRADQRTDVAIIRMELLYPFPVELMRKQLERYRNAKQFIWCQEEPKNQGSWFTSQHHIRGILGREPYLEYAGRPFLAAPAVGIAAVHAEQQRKLVAEALGEPAPKPVKKKR
ncbi:MAG: 2-oxoglutarate dehydrogenase E1 component [Pseudomonadota bacterium]